MVATAFLPQLRHWVVAVAVAPLVPVAMAGRAAALVPITRATRAEMEQPVKALRALVCLFLAQVHTLQVVAVARAQRVPRRLVAQTATVARVLPAR